MNTEKGFSIVEVMVAVVIVSIMTLALATVITDSQNSVARLEKKLEQVDFGSAFRLAIAGNAGCVATFANVDILPASLAVTSLVAGAPNPPLQIDPALIQFRGAALSAYPFRFHENLVPGNVSLHITAVGPAPNSATGQLIIALVNRPGVLGAVRPLFFDIQLTVDAAGNILNCPLGATPPAAGMDINDCRLKTEIFLQGPNVWRETTCDAGERMLTGQGIVYGTAERYQGGRVEVLIDRVRVRPQQNNWQTRLVCCRVN